MYYPREQCLNGARQPLYDLYFVDCSPAGPWARLPLDCSSPMVEPPEDPCRVASRTGTRVARVHARLLASSALLSDTDAELANEAGYGAFFARVGGLRVVESALSAAQTGVVATRAKAVGVAVVARLRCSLAVVLATEMASVTSVCLRDRMERTLAGMVRRRCANTCSAHALTARNSCLLPPHPANSTLLLPLRADFPHLTPPPPDPLLLHPAPPAPAITHTFPRAETRTTSSPRPTKRL